MTNTVTESTPRPVRKGVGSVFQADSEVPAGDRLPLRTTARMRMNATRLAAAVALAAVAFVVYHSALSAYFFDDDLQWLVGSLSFAPSSLVALGRMTHFYRPVIDVYFAAATALFGGSPTLFHAANIALHAANAVVLFALAARIGGSTLYGFAAALFFVVQPGGTDAIAWVGALAEAIGALFGCLSLLWFLRWRDTARSLWRPLSWAAFVLALLTHESSVVFLPLLILADLAFGGRGADCAARGADCAARGADCAARGSSRVAALARAYAPFVLATAAYLAIDLLINSRNYVVREGHYTLGWHIVQNGFEYLVALYVGRRDTVNTLFVTMGLAALLLRGSPRVRFSTVWMLIALAPFLAFSWSNTSRYLYQPAIGFSLLVAEAIVWLDRRLAARVTPSLRVGIAALLVAAIAVRFMLFAMHNVEGFVARTEVYRHQAAEIRRVHGDVPSHTVIEAGAELQLALSYPFATALAQWVYRDPTIRLAPY